MNKKTVCGKMICLLLILAVLISGCGSSAASEDGRNTAQTDTAAGGKRLQVVTTIFPQYDFARQIAGDCADVTMLLKPGEEVHSYEPTPQDIKLIQNSDLFIYTGGENDVWVENILASLSEKGQGPRTVRLVDLVETYEEEHLEGMMPEKGAHDHESEHDHEHESEEAEEAGHDHVLEKAEVTAAHTHAHAEADEHVWTSPENCVTLVGKLTEEFCGLDPANAEYYQKNGSACREAFEELDAQYREMAASAQRRTILFGDRFPFRYLAEELGLTCYAAFSGCSAESEPSAATIAFLIDKTAEEKLPVVFKIEFSNGNIARAVSEAAQAKMEKEAAGQGSGLSRVQVLQLHSCHNVTRDEFEAGETCLSLMTKNLEALRTALGTRAE
ncbi:MAG: metal ABC transporter substrate-binding protein [Lachnospiraceae bacterium]|nr:metal ABC transporter substrate-binding protein [Lachnospiraceae bacterium]